MAELLNETAFARGQFGERSTAEGGGLEDRIRLASHRQQASQVGKDHLAHSRLRLVLYLGAHDDRPAVVVGAEINCGSHVTRLLETLPACARWL